MGGHAVIAPATLLSLALLAPLQDAVDQAKALRRQGRPAEAAAALVDHVAAVPWDHEAAGLLGLCRLDAGDVDGARAMVEAHGLDGYRLRVLGGRLALLDDDPARAVEIVDTAVAGHERPIEGLVTLLTALERESRWVVAIEWAAVLETHQPAMGRQWGARMLERQGDRILARSVRNVEAIPRAADAYSAAWEKDRGSTGLGPKLLGTLIKCNRVEQARELLPVVHPKDTEPVEHLVSLGRIQAVSMDREAAERSFAQVLKLSPGHRDATVELARARLSVGDVEGVTSRLQPLSAKPYDPEVELLLGRARELDQDWAGAEVHFERVVARQPEHVEALYRLGRVLLRRGDSERGRELVERSRGLSRDDG
jgi:thioredoxin-like negative regulator of GroEL